MLVDISSKIIDSTKVTMSKNIIRNLSILVVPSLGLCSGIERRQTTSSSISVPTFGYGYYSDIYPTSLVTTAPIIAMAGPETVTPTTTALKDYATSWSGTDTIDLGTSTGGSNVLGSSGDVSLYTVSPTAATSTTGATTSTTSPSETRAGQASMTGSAASTGSSCGAEVVASARMLGVSLLAVICFL